LEDSEATANLLEQVREFFLTLSLDNTLRPRVCQALVSQLLPLAVTITRQAPSVVVEAEVLLEARLEVRFESTFTRCHAQTMKNTNIA